MLIYYLISLNYYDGPLSPPPPPQHPPLARGVSVCLKREAPAGKLVKQSGGNLRAMRQERERLCYNSTYYSTSLVATH